MDYSVLERDIRARLSSEGYTDTEIAEFIRILYMDKRDQDAFISAWMGRIDEHDTGQTSFPSGPFYRRIGRKLIQEWFRSRWKGTPSNPRIGRHAKNCQYFNGYNENLERECSCGAILVDDRGPCSGRYPDYYRPNAVKWHADSKLEIVGIAPRFSSKPLTKSQKRRLRAKRKALRKHM